MASRRVKSTSAKKQKLAQKTKTPVKQVQASKTTSVSKKKYQASLNKVVGQLGKEKTQESPIVPAKTHKKITKVVKKEIKKPVPIKKASVQKHSKIEKPKKQPKAEQVAKNADLDLEREKFIESQRMEIEKIYDSKGNLKKGCEPLRKKLTGNLLQFVLAKLASRPMSLGEMMQKLKEKREKNRKMFAEAEKEDKCSP